jgi:uncharacterized protein YnzC (UPF0291/DUF896 family)
MNIEFIESKINEIIKELEVEVMEVLGDQSLDKKQTNLRMKPLTNAKTILLNALDSIKMVDKIANEDIKKG